VRDTLEDRGVNMNAEWKANFMAIVSGGTRQTAGFDEEIKFRGTVDFAKLTGWEPLKGLSSYVEVRCS
jgi:carbohydrate-selective porin OprB